MSSLALIALLLLVFGGLAFGARWLARQSGDATPDRRSGRAPSAMIPPRLVRWSEDVDIVGSPGNIREKLAAYEVGGWGRQADGGPASQAESESIFAAGVHPDPSNAAVPAPCLRSSKFRWADKWQR